MPPTATSTAYMSDFQVIHSLAGEHAVYRWKNIDVCVWHKTVNEAGVAVLEALARGQAKAQELHAATRSMIHITLGTAGLPSAAVRRELSRLSERHGKPLGCLVAVIEHDGFAASALRGITTGLLTFTTKAATHRIVRDVEQAAAWLPEPHARVTGVHIDERELRHALQAMRATIPQSTPSGGAQALASGA